MAENSGIGWTHHTQNFWQGCNKVSAECTHCYIDGFMRLASRVLFGGPMRTKNWSHSHRRERQTREQGRRFREAGIAHFFKQRYEAGRIVHDGLLDGEIRQLWSSVGSGGPRS